MVHDFKVSVLSVLMFLSACHAFAGDYPIPALPMPADDQITASVENSWVYMYTHDRSPHTNGAHDCGRTFLLAVSCWNGDTRGDYRLLKQIRANLSGDTCLVAAGAYGSQHERIFTASCVLIKHTPRLWSQLSDDEKHRMDLLMKAAMVASAYTTSDAGAADGRQNPDLMGGKNHNRGWNPNYREGMIGMMIVGTIWMGDADATYEFLNNYNHKAFTTDLQAAGLTNTYKTFSVAAKGKTRGAPTAKLIQRDIRDYHYLGMGLDEIMKIYWTLTTHTYKATVTAGLNNGAGFQGAGKLASGAKNLPNIGKKGMLYEFASMDAGGPRSSISYAYTGFRPNLINQITLLISGNWQPGKMADECVALQKIGIQDLYYKLGHGYIDYSKGHASRKASTIDSDGWDHFYMRSLWYDVVEKFHDGKATCANAGSDINASSSNAVKLDASASVAAESTKLTAYTWLDSENQIIATGKNAEVKLAPGKHSITLIVKDSAGRESRDTINISIASGR